MFEQTPPLPPNSRYITKRELALGILSKPFYRGDYSCARYLNHDDIVSFQLDKQTNDFNAEFIVNKNTWCRIWLSQLNQIYIDAEKLELHCGRIFPKNQEPIQLACMFVDDFINATKGKNFQVVVNDDMYAIDRWNERCRHFGTFGEIQKYIVSAFNEERYDDVKGMTKKMVCYDFIEM